VIWMIFDGVACRKGNSRICIFDELTSFYLKWGLLLNLYQTLTTTNRKMIGFIFIDILIVSVWHIGKWMWSGSVIFFSLSTWFVFGIQNKDKSTIKYESCSFFYYV